MIMEFNVTALEMLPGEEPEGFNLCIITCEVKDTCVLSDFQ
jgi:hypothetical protein